MPHFEVIDVNRGYVSYSTFWQRKNLVLVTLPDFEQPSREYADSLMARVAALNDDETEWIVTRDRLAKLPSPGVLVADRWGEVAHVSHPSHVTDLPSPDELVGWVRDLQYRCPECEGEAK